MWFQIFLPRKYWKFMSVEMSKFKINKKTNVCIKHLIRSTLRLARVSTIFRFLHKSSRPREIIVRFSYFLDSLFVRSVAILDPNGSEYSITSSGSKQKWPSTLSTVLALTKKKLTETDIDNESTNSKADRKETVKDQNKRTEGPKNEITDVKRGFPSSMSAAQSPGCWRPICRAGFRSSFFPRQRSCIKFFRLRCSVNPPPHIPHYI